MNQLKQAMIEKVKRLLILNYQKDPIGWYEHRFGGTPSDIIWTLHEGYENHEWDGDPDPFKIMFEKLAQWKNVGIESATSTGKTYMLPRIAYWFLDVFPNSLVVSTAPKQQQLKSVLWAEMSNCFLNFKRIRPDAEMFSLRVLPNGKSLNFRRGAQSYFDEQDAISDTHQAIGVVSGVRADEESSVRMQGYHRKYMLFIIEECAGVPAPVLTAIKNTCTGDFNAIVAVGNPDNVLDSLHQFCMLPYVEHIRISAFDHPNIVLGKTVIHGAVTQKSIDEREDEYGKESWLYKSRVRGICASQGVDSLIMYDWVVRAIVGHDKYKEEKFKPDEWSHNALGVDVANSKAGDQACLCWGEGNEVKSIHEFHCEDANSLAHNLVNNDPAVLKSQGRMYYGTGTLEQWNVNFQNVGVDGVGIGVGTVNEFNAMGWQIVSLTGGPWKEAIPYVIEGDEKKPLYSFVSLRAQMYYQLRLDLVNYQIKINITDPRTIKKLTEQLTIIKYQVSDKHIKIEPKEEIKKRMSGESPDIADALVYWNWVRRFRKGNWVEAPIYGGLKADDVKF